MPRLKNDSTSVVSASPGPGGRNARSSQTNSPRRAGKNVATATSPTRTVAVHAGQGESARRRNESRPSDTEDLNTGSEITRGPTKTPPRGEPEAASVLR